MTVATSSSAEQTHEFKAEIRQLLDILIHSVYTSKDVFLRELISNASDALEKTRFSQASGVALVGADQPLEIRIELGETEGRKTLTITDTGIGMTEAEVHANIGTIARSGATAFLEQLKQKPSGGDEPTLSLIGRFGVGFYSVFMVAERVRLTTRSGQPDAPPVRWTSDGLGSYRVETVEDETPRGTRIEIELRAGEERFADAGVIKSTIARYSNFVAFPIYVAGELSNQTTALWREPATRLADEQYNEFYKLISHDFQPPLLRIHDSADAPLQYSALLFVPASNPEALGFGRGEPSTQLYVKRVLIDAENKHLLPQYLRFVKGVVESDDLPLNVSRETLQENRVVAKMRDMLTRKLLDLFLKTAAEQPEEYRKFWDAYGRMLKEGYGDFAHRQKLQDLMRFASSRSDESDALVSLAQYVEAMPVGQKAIYYLSGPSREAIARDARLEVFRRKKIEVLYLPDPADEFVLGNWEQYKDKPFVSADQVKLDDLRDLGPSASETEATPAATAAETQTLMDCFKRLLGERVLDVRLSERLVDSPVCLVNEEGGVSAHWDKLMRHLHKTTDLPRRVFEMNPRHPLIQGLARRATADANDPFIADACEQLFEGAMLLDGFLTDPHRFVERMTSILTAAVKPSGG